VVIVIQLPQGYWPNLSGTDKDRALSAFAAADKAFLVKHPQCAKYHRPSWREFDARESETAPWGHEWYVVDADGRLQMHSADYDSSG
jgi:hypothetical protein